MTAKGEKKQRKKKWKEWGWRRPRLGRGAAGHRPRGRRGKSPVARRPPGRAGGKAESGLLPTERDREREKREKRERREREKLERESFGLRERESILC